MLIDKPDGTQIHIPEEQIAIDEHLSRWHGRNLSRAAAVTVTICAIVYLLGGVLK